MRGHKVPKKKTLKQKLPYQEVTIFTKTKKINHKTVPGASFGSGNNSFKAKTVISTFWQKRRPPGQKRPAVFFFIQTETKIFVLKIHVDSS